MAGHDQDWNRIPWWSWMAPVAAIALLSAGSAHLLPSQAAVAAPLAVVALCSTIFAAVHHAEVLAIRIGEPLGSILLALAITALEVGLIVSVMISGAEGSPTIVRDTVFSVVMIVLNGIVGLCLVMGSARHFEQEFRVQGASAILSVIATLAIVTLILPNYTLTTAAGTYASSQLLFVGISSLLLYVLFVFVQTVRHRSDFVIEPASPEHGPKPAAFTVAVSAILMLVSLVAVILLAKSLSPVLEEGVLRAGLPLMVVGVVIASVVLLPEGLTAIKAAARNRLQTSLNTSLGSAAASIGLTIPIVGLVSIYLGQPLTLGLEPESMVLLLLTLFVSTLTFATGRTTVMQGAVHLFIFGVFLLLAAIP